MHGQTKKWNWFVEFVGGSLNCSRCDDTATAPCECGSYDCVTSSGWTGVWSVMFCPDIPMLVSSSEIPLEHSIKYTRSIAVNCTPSVSWPTLYCNSQFEEEQVYIKVSTICQSLSIVQVGQLARTHHNKQQKIYWKAQVGCCYPFRPDLHNCCPFLLFRVLVDFLRWKFWSANGCVS